MAKLNEFSFLSSDKKTNLHAMEWLPDGQAKAVVQIVHGVAEHIARYDGFARFLCDNGFAVYGHDHLGHGKSVTANGTPVYFGDGNTWETVTDDIKGLQNIIKERFGGLPLFLMGHSMGSFLARSFLIRYPGQVSGAVIMGTGWQPGYMLAGGLAISFLFSHFKTPYATSDFVTKLAFGAYNKAFAPARTPVDWLSADRGNVDRYIADPLSGNDTTVGLFNQMLKGIRFNQRKENLKKMDKNTPVLFISGEDDPVGNMMKGVAASKTAFEKAGVKDLTLISYKGLRHEILNESSQNQTVYADLLGWFNKYC